ncbi:general stress protein [Tessaracoccus caeni]|uniref:general stress protein n=1 Tax=Tessaracoccus caeni TaxID=3031239 RepID=UPI0023DBEAC2|nr:general stress protein [Tessaracoccus caeni]MDF1487666.1 hypothetical protein [Tessaracoccus caeni]
MSSPMMNPKKGFELSFPQSLASFRSYEEAQKAVDYLADKGFPVQNLMIVGAQLKSLERVTGRRTWGSVLGKGAASGITTGLLVGLMLMIFLGGNTPTGLLLLAGLALGMVMGVISAGLGYSMTQGKRDFESMRQIVATSYEVLCEHKVTAQAKELLDQMPGFRAQYFQ